jgi:hypothetical protein
MGIFSLGFASCLANKYCSIPGFANPGNLFSGSFMEEAPGQLFPRWRPPASADSESLK